MTGPALVAALAATYAGIVERHGGPPLLGAPANENWVCEEEGA